MTTVAGLVEATRRHLLGAHRPELNVLSSSMTATTTSTTLTLTYTPLGINQGSYLGIGDELLYVLAVDSTSKQVTVLRAQMGSTAGAHASPDIVEVNPMFPRAYIKATLAEEIASWPEDMFRVESYTIAGGVGGRAFDLGDVPLNFYSILELNRAPYSSEIENADRRVAFTFERTADLDRFPSGQALVLRGPLDVDVDLFATVALPYDLDTFTDTTNVEDDIGVHAEAHDIPALGAAWRLTIGRELRRTFMEGQPEPRRAEEVPATANLRASEGLRSIRDLRLSNERARLRGRWPYHSTR